MKVGIETKGFDGWGGGIDFIRHITSCIETANKRESHDVNLFLAKNNAAFWLKRQLHPYRTLFHSLVNGQPLGWEPWQGFDQNYLEHTFIDLQSIKKLAPGYSLRSHLAYARKQQFDVLLPCFTPPPKNFTLPWVGYIYDFQHKYLPHLFDARAISIRNKNFFEMLNKAKHIVVNAHAVKHDAKKFFGDYSAKIHVLPFSPSPKLAWLHENRDMRQQYDIDKPYFIICNQFWKHKNHSTAFSAFARLISSEGNNLQLVCTGTLKDSRDPSYFPSLMKNLDDLGIQRNVKILGHIPKIDQIALLKGSIAVIQPTLFEGGPGGGASYDAISLGQPLIISNIPVNREISDCSGVTFFEPLSPEDLADCMLDALRKPFIRPDNMVLWEQGCQRKLYCGETLFKLIEEAVNGH